MRLREFAPAGGGGSGNYFQALASAWYNGVFDTGSLPKGIKTQEDVERLLNRGIVCPDGKTRKLHIDYNSDFDGVEIYSDDYYEYGDHDDTIDSRTGQKWGPYDFMAFSDEDLSEGLNEFAADDGDSGGEDDALRNYARMWWAGDEATQMQIERALAKMGWEIGEDEGSYDNGGVFVVRAGDENGNSYQSWAAEDLTEGVAEGHADQQRKVFKKNGHPVGEVGIDRESSPGNGQWYMKYYATGDDFGGYDSMEEAVADLKHLVNQFKAEGVAEGLSQTLRKVVPGHAKREIDKKMDAGKFGKTDADKDANFQRYKKIQDKIKEQGVAEGSYDNDTGITHTRGSLVAKLEALPKGSDDFEWNRIQAIHHLKQGNMLRAKYYMALMKRGEQGVAEDRLDELSPKTLGSYINKATKDAGTLGYGLGDINARLGKYKDSPDVVKDVKHSFNNRIKGVEKASHRLTKEQGVAESDDKYAELSKKIRDLAQAGKEGEANKLRYELNRLLMLDRDKKRRQERGVAEGTDDPFGPKGRFVGDTGPAQISATVPRVQLRIGDRVMYKPTEQRARIEALSRDGTQARIHIASAMGGRTFNCKTADLKPIGQGSLEEKSTSQAQFRTMAAAAHDPKFAKKVGIKPSVAKEFNRADQGQSYKSLPKKAH